MFPTFLKIENKNKILNNWNNRDIGMLDIKLFSQFYYILDGLSFYES